MTDQAEPSYGPQQCVYCGSSKTDCLGPWDDGLGHGGIEWHCVACDQAWSDPSPGKIVYLRFRPAPASDGSARQVAYGPFSWVTVRPDQIRACKRRSLGELEVVTIATTKPSGEPAWVAGPEVWFLNETIEGKVRRFADCTIDDAPLLGADHEDYYDMDGVKRRPKES